VRNPLARLAALGTHHSTHRHLLARERLASAPGARVDALIVPTARPISWLREAMTLAAALRCVLVAVCSLRVRAVEVMDLGFELGVPTLAVDMPDARHVLPASMGTRLLDGTSLVRMSDASQKRNLALLLARLAGWQRVLLLDDDIYRLDSAHARAAVGLLERYNFVGLENHGFPDNSVVCHAYREVGGMQGQFVGAGALAVDPTRSRSFFPDTYNADWLFVSGDSNPPRVAVTGSMRQKDFDPFASPKRAQDEEFGDCLAEGLYWLLDGHRSLEQADMAHWTAFLGRRQRFIDRLMLRVCRVVHDPDRQAKLLASLQVAQETNEKITPELCAEYVNCWRSDLTNWQRFIDDLPTGLGVDEALNQLGLAGVVHRHDPE
jgi:hypothetical protein